MPHLPQLQQVSIFFLLTFYFFSQIHTEKKDTSPNDIVKEVNIIEEKDGSGQILFSKMELKSGLIVSVDCRWSSPHNGEEATVSVIDVVSGKVVEVEHLMRCREHKEKQEIEKCEKEDFEQKLFQMSEKDFVTLRRKKRSFHGTSKKMEGVGVKRCFHRFKLFFNCFYQITFVHIFFHSLENRLKEKGILIAALVHDNDASTLNHVKLLFPEVVEFLDVNHARKNFKKKLEKLKKDVFKRSLSLKEIDRLSNHFRRATYISKGDPMKFVKVFLNFFNHTYGFCNEHCQHALTETIGAIDSEEEISTFEQTQTNSENSNSQSEKTSEEQNTNSSPSNQTSSTQNDDDEEEEFENVVFDLWGKKMTMREAFFDQLNMKDTEENRKILTKKASERNVPYLKIENDSNLSNILKIFELICRYAKKAKNYAHCYNSNSNEALNNMITKWAPKRLDLEQSYCLRANLAILKFNYKNNFFKLEILKMFQFDVSQEMVDNQLMLDLGRFKISSDKKTLEGKAKIVKNKMQKKERGKVGMNNGKDEDCQYKEDDPDGVGEGSRKRKSPSKQANSNKKRKLNDGTHKRALPKCSGCGKLIKDNDHSKCVKKVRSKKSTASAPKKTK